MYPLGHSTLPILRVEIYASLATKDQIRNRESCGRHICRRQKVTKESGRFSKLPISKKYVTNIITSCVEK